MGSKRGRAKAAICPAGGGIRAEISNSQAVAPGPTPRLRRGEKPTWVGGGSPVSLLARGEHLLLVPPGLGGASPQVPRGARGRCAAAREPRPRVPAPAPLPGTGRPAAAGQIAQPPPGVWEAFGRRGGARDTVRVESGAREPWRRFSCTRLSTATMAFGKSHRDPYATSVGHLIGKEARGEHSPASFSDGWGGGRGDPTPFDSF